MDLAIEHLQRGFLSLEQIEASRAVMSSDPLYRAAGYVETEPRVDMVDGIEVPLVRMRKGTLARRPDQFATVLGRVGVQSFRLPALRL